ncbi:DUF2336 domain-containing protein [Bradyrhizobium lablabi]|uniref:DUF2336 domain-containing protein n=1 Tax=Bradyrhizobium lablabi TaxID=722472 RepID=UPI001BA86EE7|nr:DUF2336 domain-containing protein [Bradyrhizobium lablabi]MBR0692909.1 DUF2336 domain-containing protein [Bradyrhizobium lablabi]
MRILRQVASLFLADVERLNEHHIDVFDDVLVRLTESVETRTLTKLSGSIADVRSVPRELARRLAHHEDADVAAPILLKCASLSNDELIDVAKARGERHLVAVAGRRTLGEKLTDILLMRGESGVCRTLARNPGAQFSAASFAILVDAAERDDDVAHSLVMRDDLPHGVLNDLIAKSTPAAQARLLKAARPDMQDAIRKAIDAGTARAQAKKPVPVDYTEAKAAVLALNNAGQLNDSSVNRFAVRRDYRHLVAALAQLATVPTATIELLLEHSDIHGLVVACRASRLNWTTTAAIVNSRKAGPALSREHLEQAREMFETLPLSNAQRLIRFGSINELTANPPSAAGAT